MFFFIVKLNLLSLCFPQEVEVGMEAANTTTDSGVSSLPATDNENEESQGQKEKAPVRFGWVTGVMVRKASVDLRPKYGRKTA